MLLLLFSFLLSTGEAFALLPVIESLQSQNSSNSPVILISMDGFRADYWDKVETPYFHELMKRGMTASNLKPVFPSVTFVNHFSIVTGLFSENHGIVNNSMWDPFTQRAFEIRDISEVDRSEWWEGEPLWVTAEKQGVKSASMFWVGSSAEIKGVRPTYWLPYDRSFPRLKRVLKVLEWIDLPEEKRPKFITLYFEDADEAGHAHGPESKEVKQAIKNLDEALGLLWEGLKARGIEEDTTLLLLSDHGMAQVERENRIRTSQYIKLSEARVVGKGAIALVWPKGKKETARILERVKSKPGHFQLFTKENMPPQFHYSKHRRISPIVFVANQGWYLDTDLFPSIKPAVFGLHGYDNSLPEMQAVFLATGPRFPKNQKAGEVQNIDLYPLIANLLKIKPSQTDGNFERVSKVVGLKSK